MDTPDKALEYIITNAPKYAKAKADRRYLEEFRKTVKAKLYLTQSEGTMADREAYAYSHADYQEILSGLKAAIEIEEELRWRMQAAELKVHIWQTTSANNRFIEKGTT